MVGDPTEGALLVAAAKAGALPAPLAQAYPRIEEIPFDSERKRMVTVHAIENPDAQDVSPFYDQKHHAWYVLAEKGAPDVVLERCTHYQNRDDKAIRTGTTKPFLLMMNNAGESWQPTIG